MAQSLSPDHPTQEHFHDPARNTYRYIHLPDTSWISQRDPPEFDDALLQSLEQKRQELDAKVARYIAKKQGQFNDYVAEKNRRYDLRTEDRQKRRAAQQERDHEQAMAEACEDASGAPHLMEDDSEASWFTKQREEDARKRAEAVSEEVAKSDTTYSDSPDAAAHATLSTVRERDSEILQLLPGFLPLLEDQEKLSSSAPAANRGDGRPSRNPRSELIRSSTMPPSLSHRPAPRRSSLKQSNGDRPGSARKAVRLSLGPSIVTPTQSPPNDGPSTSTNHSAQTSLSEETLRNIQREIEEAERWKSEPERIHTEEIPIEDLLSATAHVNPRQADIEIAPDHISSPSSASPEKGKAKAGSSVNDDNSENAGSEKQPSPPQSKPNYSASPLNFGKEEIPQRPTASLGRRSSLTEEAKSAPKEPKKKKKKKVKTATTTGLPTYTPARAPTTTALSSTAPEVGTSSARSIANSSQQAPQAQSASLLSSSFVDANNTGIFYPTRSRPPPSHMRPDEASLSAVDVPLPVGGLSSSDSPPTSYGSALRGASLGESYMALNFARRMEKNKAERKDGGNSVGGSGVGRKNKGKAGQPPSHGPLREVDEDEDDEDDEADRLVRQREEKYRRDRMQDEEEFAGELDL
ncbi:hypothetical protein MPH_00813 [Macrophomina phaseolina MS6]|uniref:Uncharacterized protein n=1 Tax=Macrophomina phaseolina (strain MS6) TaxID=1126212 RepID=K2S4L6_MACPH|nr:hypothetical protein MPH_00813 [Macrophomina phaseolina MS6]